MDGEQMTVKNSASGKQPALLSEIWAKKGFILKALVVLVVFGLLQVGNQYAFIPYNADSDVLIRAAALGGATLVGLSMLLGSLAVLFPKYNYIKYRRAVGVAGFLLIWVHFALVFNIKLKLSTQFLFGSLNPFANGLFMGFVAYLPLILLFITSTDYATRKLGQQNWKNLHRLIYVSFLLYVMHALIMTQRNPERLFNPAGYLLLLTTISAAVLQLFAFIKRIRMGHSRPIAFYVGAFLILAYLAILATFFFARNLLVGG
ncbi:MAG: ferric reductase-like transmembrane domain-containing protein [Candidatus Micrarchaeota archaeon]